MKKDEILKKLNEKVKYCVNNMLIYFRIKWGDIDFVLYFVIFNWFYKGVFKGKWGKVEKLEIVEEVLFLEFVRF